MRKIIIPLLFAPAAYQLVAGTGRSRVTVLVLLFIFGAAIAGEFWAAKQPDSWISRVLYAPRLVSTARVGVVGLALIGLYVIIIAAADNLKVLDSAAVLTVGFVVVFLGLIALAAVVDRGIQRLRGKRHAG